MEHDIKQFNFLFFVAVVSLLVSGLFLFQTANNVIADIDELSLLVAASGKGGGGGKGKPIKGDTGTTTTTATTTGGTIPAEPLATSTTQIIPTWSDALNHLTSPGAGWTAFNLPSNNKIVYVSQTEGNDGCNGSSPAPFSSTNTLNCPKKTIAATVNLLTPGAPGWVLFKKGDSWGAESLGAGTFTSGTASEPRVVSSYGSSGARPVIKSLNLGTGVRDHVAIAGLNFLENVRWVGGGTNLLFEDLFIHKGLVIDETTAGPISNVKIRRNLIVDNFASSGNTHDGIFIEGVDGVVIEENILDRNGYDTADFRIVQSDTVIPYNLYIQNTNRNVVVRGNISMRSASSGVQMRAGGLLEDNLFIDNGIGITMGATDSNVNKIANNVVLSGKDILIADGATRLCRAWGIGVDEAYGNPVEISGNLIAHSKSAWRPGDTIACPAVSSQGRPQGIFFSPTSRNILVQNNTVYRWETPLLLSTSGPGPTASDAITIANNAFVYNKGIADIPLVRIRTVGAYDVDNAFNFSGNHYYDSSQPLGKWFNLSFESLSTPAVDTVAKWSQVTGEADLSVVNPPFASPQTIEQYAQAIGAGSTIDDFARELRQQSKDYWREAYTAGAINNYFRAAFRR